VRLSTSEFFARIFQSLLALALFNEKLGSLSPGARIFIRRIPGAS